MTTMQPVENSENLVSVTGSAIHVPQVLSEKQAENQRVRERVLVLRDQMTESYFELGRLLHRISQEMLYTQWSGPDGENYEKFSDYVEHEVSFQFRKAKHLMSIWWWFSEQLGSPEVIEKVKAIGWNKAALLVGVVDARNVDVWVDKANRLSVPALQFECKMALEKAGRKKRPGRERTRRLSPPATPESTDPVESETGGPLESETTDLPESEPPAEEDPQLGVDPLTDDEAKEHCTIWRVQLDGEQRQNVESAIDIAAEMAEVTKEGKGFLLDYVATAFVALHNGTVGDNKRQHRENFRIEILTAVERCLGVDIVAFDAHTDDPVYGRKTIERIGSDR